MNEIEINYIRIISDFKSITFSDYKKTSVTKELLNSLVNSKVEHACNWAAELICSGHFSDLWETILLFIGKNVHLGNPKLPIYIEMRFNKFKDVLLNGYLDNELSMRNNEKIRKLFAEIICVLCKSRKNHSFESIKIKKQEEFDITHMSSKLKADNVKYVEEVFLKDDPKELFIAINEFSYNISKKIKNTIEACYWIEWVMEFELICKKKNENCLCERRTFAPVNEKFQMDVIWIIWDVLLNQCSKNNNPLCSKIMNSLLNIFSIKYKSGIKRRRRYLLYFAVALITENVDYSIEMISDKKEIDILISKINVVYKEIKKNEKKPSTDYLFNGVERSNLDKTIQKLDIMKNLKF